MPDYFEAQTILMTICTLCGGSTNRVIESLPGYQVGKTFQINYCLDCDTSVAVPLEVDENLYNFIYLNAQHIPGYDRYYRYADDVLLVKDPLKFLAESEDTYWSISHFIKKVNKQPNPKILEVGCGLGYLTYALVHEGYDATGIDISEQAVTEASRRYGNNYERVDIYELVRSQHKTYDIVIMTEVIEHIPDPKGFILTLKSLLSENGSLLITTPSKDVDDNKSQYWNTELPPVHLWWFSEKSFIQLSKAIHMNVAFIDYNLYLKKQINYPVAKMAWRTQTLGDNGKVLFQMPHHPIRYALKRKLIDFNLLSGLKSVILSLKKSNPAVKAQRLTAIFTTI